MADDAQALSPLSSTSPASDADYDVIYAAVMETGRGRWFLQEYARRNRNADTEVLLHTLERIEETIRSERASISVDRIKFDLHEMARAIVRTKAEIAAIRPSGDGRLTEAGAELGSIVKAAEGATHRVLQAAEQVQELAFTMRERGIDPVACDRLNALATEIYLACEFQDLTGQRTGKIVQVLGFLEQRINAMVEIWGDDEAPPAERRAAPEMDQTDIDVVMAPPGTRVETGFPINPAMDHEPVDRGTGIPDELADALDRKAGLHADGAAEAADAEAEAEPAADSAAQVAADGEVEVPAQVAAEVAADGEAEVAALAQALAEPVGSEAADGEAGLPAAAEVAPEAEAPEAGAAESAEAAADLVDIEEPADIQDVEDPADIQDLVAVEDPGSVAPAVAETAEALSEDDADLAVSAATPEPAAEPEDDLTAGPATAMPPATELPAEAPIPDDLAAAALAAEPEPEIEPEPETVIASAPDEAPSPFGAALAETLAAIFEPFPEQPRETAGEPQDARSEVVAEIAEETAAIEAAPAAAQPAPGETEAPIEVDIETVGAVETAAVAPDEPVAPAAEAEPVEPGELELAELEPAETVEAPDTIETIAPVASSAPAWTAAPAPDSPPEPASDSAPTDPVDEIASEMRALLEDWPATDGASAAAEPAEAAAAEPAIAAAPEASEDEPQEEQAETIETLAATAPEPAADILADDTAAEAREPAEAFAVPFVLELWAADIIAISPQPEDLPRDTAQEVDGDLFDVAPAAAGSVPEPQPAEVAEAADAVETAETEAPAIVATPEPAETPVAQDNTAAADHARPLTIDSIADEIRALLTKWEPEVAEPAPPVAIAPEPAAAETGAAAAEAATDEDEAAEPAPLAAEAEPAPAAAAEAPVEAEPAEATEAAPAEPVQAAAETEDGKEEELTALLFEPARPAVQEAEIVLAGIDGAGAEPEPAAAAADETVWTPIDGVLPDWGEGPAAPAKAVEAAFLSATAASMAAMAEIAGNPATVRPVSSDPLAPVKAMSDEERIALFS